MSEYTYESMRGNTTLVSYGKTPDQSVHIAVAAPLDEQEWLQLAPAISGPSDEFTLNEQTDYEFTPCSLITLSGNIDNMAIAARTFYARHAVIGIAGLLNQIRKYDTVKFRLAAGELFPHDGTPIYPNYSLFDGKFKKFTSREEATRTMNEEVTPAQSFSDMVNELRRES